MLAHIDRKSRPAGISFFCMWHNTTHFALYSPLLDEFGEGTLDPWNGDVSKLSKDARDDGAVDAQILWNEGTTHDGL